MNKGLWIWRQIQSNKLPKRSTELLDLHATISKQWMCSSTINHSTKLMTDLILNIFIVRGFYFLVDFGYKGTCKGPELELG
jgi:hypothetical protein